MKTLKNWRLEHHDDTTVQLRVHDRHLICINILDNKLFRVRLLKDGAWRLNRSWTVNPDGHTLPKGRSRDSVTGFSCPQYKLGWSDGQLQIETDALRLIVSQPLHFRWEAFVDEGWKYLTEDRPTGAYMLGVKNHAHAHYLRRHPDERVYGLGEKAGLLERTGRRFEMRSLDAMGYDAERTDPLYKHLPFTLTQTASTGSFSIFYDTLNTCVLNIGQELDNYHAPYRSFTADDGDLDYYFRWSPQLLDLVKSQLALTGGMAFPPRWSLGYSGSTMAYTDAPDAQDQLIGFLRKLENEAIPCDSFHLSSGYTSIEDKRYVFHWNNDKVPNPTTLTKAFNDSGVRLIANIKPCLLRNHPRYAEVANNKLFIQDSESDTPELSSFWDDEGSHLDFTNPDTLSWWKENVTQQLLNLGITSTWNDNNEFEVWDHGARCVGFGEEVEVGLIRPLHSLLMVHASWEAQSQHAPQHRPYVVTRSGCAGLQQFAQTWTGDNKTSWESLRWNIRMGLGLSLSGIYNIGHDVGGFAGPQPGPELLLRWVQNGIFHPRFSIHSWNNDGSVTEPWTHPSVTEGIRAAIQFRYRLLPYFYTCLWQAVNNHEPMLRPTFLDHENDAQTYADTDDFLLGRDLLVASVVEQGADKRRIYLPDNHAGWWDYWTGQLHAPGTWLEKPVSLADMPLFVKAGSILPLANEAIKATPEAQVGRTLALFPQPGSFSCTSLIYDDDGESKDGPHCITTLLLTGDEHSLELQISQAGDMPFPFKQLNIVLPAGENRPLHYGGRVIEHGGLITVGEAS
ncbi:TIM-barrel domain-containing protein [Halomonas sp. KHS3]|uniref:glycoside hydrolase family 31 protein n=1 Tax=Halomonadaceae TaxID=28256 RepID=UPI00059AF623|nr:TIM-barrel domain-containing protein [Halomonas sp. KHS3]KIN15958.1 alpha-glucosidase [Halomonas sp. KHS3]